MAAKSRASKLPAKINAKRNTKSGRAKMSPSNFALPGKKYRIDDAAHARGSLAYVARYGTPKQKNAVRTAVAKKYPSIKVSGIKRKGK